MVTNNHGYEVLIWILHRQQMFNTMEDSLVIWIVKTCALIPLIGWYNQGRGGPSEDWKVAALLFVMPSHHLFYGNVFNKINYT